MQVLKLLEACEVYQPKTIPKKDLIEDGKYFVYGANGKIGRFNEYNHPEEEVLLGCRGSVGSLNISEPYSWITGNAMVVKPKSNQLLKKYIYYFLYSLNKKNIITGSSIPQITRKSLENTKIPVPSLQEQEKIVERLDKVEKRNTELYKIYKKQFIDLKNLYEGYLNESFSKMNKNLTPLQLSTINITDGSHNPAKGVDKSDYMMLSSKNVIEDDLNFENPRYLKKEDFLLENKRTNLETNDVLLTIVGTIGRTAVVKSLEHNITFQRSVCVIKPNKEILDSYYLKYFLDNISSFLEQNARGVAQKGIYLNQIRGINIPLMDLDRQQQLVTKIKKVNNLVKEITSKKKEQILKQEQLKKSILNKEFAYE
jgi:restriction endonuclease S subunit